MSVFDNLMKREALQNIVRTRKISGRGRRLEIVLDGLRWHEEILFTEMIQNIRGTGIHGESWPLT